VEQVNQDSSLFFNESLKQEQYLRIFGDCSVFQNKVEKTISKSSSEGGRDCLEHSEIHRIHQRYKPQTSTHIPGSSQESYPNQLFPEKLTYSKKIKRHLRRVEAENLKSMPLFGKAIPSTSGQRVIKNVTKIYRD